MATKRQHSPEIIPNPFIKKRNREWTLRVPDVPALSSPPQDVPDLGASGDVTSAAIEAGRAVIDDHVAHFGTALERATKTSYPAGAPRLLVDAYRALYEANANSGGGAHFVIHQHDHPVAGTHYDLRLQINGTSSASWAVMYGMPGDANSVKLARNATETRVHCLWNHLIETASSATGSLLIWDTGTYTILPRRSKHAPAIDPSSQTSHGELSSPSDLPRKTEQQKLHDAFQQRKIKIQLHGARLPEPYVLNMRLTKAEDIEGRAKARRSADRGVRRRRRAGQNKGARGKQLEETSSEDEDEELDDGDLNGNEPSDQQPVAEPEKGAAVEEEALPGKAPTEMTEEMRRELEEQEDAHVRATNAYTGADNSIGSVHQRKWFLSLDREACGFVRRKRQRPAWVRESDPGEGGGDARLQYPFYVRGPEAETSVITGRLASEVLCDEGVTKFVGRKGWQPVLR